MQVYLRRASDCPSMYSNEVQQPRRIGNMRPRRPFHLHERPSVPHVQIAIQPGEWAAALELADAGSYVELLVPLPTDEQNANAVRRLRKARDLMRDDNIEEALGETRKATEKIRAVYGTGKLAAAAAKNDARQHTKQERWAVYVESIFSLLSGAVHDDHGTTENFVWTRAEADALIVSVAGMLGRLAEDERSYIT
jgi:hypothetical protein